MAGFVIVAVVLHPIGGWLSDSVGPIPIPIPVLTAVYAVLTVGAVLRSFPTFYGSSDASRLSQLCGGVLPGQAKDGDFVGGGRLGVCPDFRR